MLLSILAFSRASDKYFPEFRQQQENRCENAPSQTYTETPTRMPNLRQRDVCQMHQNEL